MTMKHLFCCISILAFTLLGMNTTQAQSTLTPAEQAQLKKEKTYRPVLESWQRRLQLTDAQMQTLQPFMEEYQSQLQTLKEEHTLPHAEKKQKAAELRMLFHDRTRAVLTEKQLKKFNRYYPQGDSPRKPMR